MALYQQPVENLDDMMESNIATLLLNKAKLYGSKPALIDADTGKVLTFSELYKKSRQVAFSLHKTHGLNRGDVLLIMSQNCADYMCVMFGALAIGVTVTTGSPAYLWGEFRQHVSDSDATYVLASQDVVDKVKSFSADIPTIKKIFVMGESENCISYKSMTSTDVEELNIEAIATNPKDDLAFMLCSSGTTGTPKLVMHTHYSIQYDLLRHRKHCVGYYSHAEHPTTMLWYLPIFNGWGLHFTLWSCLTGGCDILMKAYDQSLLLKCIKQHKVNVLPLSVPIFLDFARNNDVTAEDFDQVESFVYAGAVIATSILENFFNKFSKQKKINVYGTTETFTISATPYETEHFARLGSAGRLYAGLSVKVVDPITGEEKTFNENGELLIKGDNTTIGYNKRPEANAASFIDGGWCKTGDLGHVDKDGFIYIVDRLKEVMKVGHSQVSPSELEGILLSHPKIKDCAVIGIPHETLIEIPRAFVVLKNGQTASENDIQEYVKGMVQDIKTLRGGVSFVDSIPKSAMGKTLRRKLRDQVKTENSQ